MQYYRCACGQTESFASIPPFPCEACPNCGTTLGQQPNDIHRPIPHRYDVWRRCACCHISESVGVLPSVEHKVTVRRRA